MLTLEHGAKMLIVAWVKDWGMRSLFEVLTQQRKISDENILEMVKHFPFMPSHMHWYLANRGHGINTQQYVAQAFPKLSEKLYNTDDNKVRLSYAPYIMKQKVKGIRAIYKYDKADRAEHSKTKRAYKQEWISYKESRDAFKKHQRGAWNVVK